MKIVYVYGDRVEAWNRSERRCAIPARALNRTNRHSASLISQAEFDTQAPRARQFCKTADLIIFQGTASGAALKAAQHWCAQGKVLIGDMDGTDGFSPCGSERAGLGLVSGVTMPSRRMAADWQSLAHVFHLPTFLEPERYQVAGRESAIKGVDEIIIGWRGGRSHLQAFRESGVAEALRRVCLARPKVRVLLSTSDPRLQNVLSLPPRQVIWQPLAPYPQWPFLLALFDIGIAPLSGEVDQQRGWVQVLEYMAQQIPWIASEGPAYYDLGRFGWLVKNKENAWERVLLDMVDHLDDYQAEARRDPYLFVAAQSMDENIEKLVHIYSNIASGAAGANFFQNRI